MGKLLSDIFSMSFDVIIPLSSCITAVMIAAVLFFIRYLSYRRNKRKYEKEEQQGQQMMDSIAVKDIDHISGRDVR